MTAYRTPAEVDTLPVDDTLPKTLEELRFWEVAYAAALVSPSTYKDVGERADRALEQWRVRKANINAAQWAEFDAAINAPRK